MRWLEDNGGEYEHKAQAQTGPQTPAVEAEADTENISGLSLKTMWLIALTLGFILLCLLTLYLILEISSPTAQAQSLSSTPTKQGILTVVLHNAQGQPLSGVTCEILSYDWGLKMGQPYTVIARGETDLNGVVAFDDSVWPHSGYRFRFRATERTRPANTYFLPEGENTYRGYPGAVVGGGQSDTQYFAIDSDGLPYNDLASGQGIPNIQKDPVGGLLQPRVTIMPSKDYFATVRADTATAYAEGTPIAPTPAPPPTFSGVAALALTITPIATAAAISSITTTTSATGSKAAGTGSGIGPTPPNSFTPTTVYVSAPPAPDSPSNFIVALLGVVGAVSLLTFWHYRYVIYYRLGIEVIAPKSKRKRKKAGLLARLFRKGAAVRSKPGRTAQPKQSLKKNNH